MEEAGSLGLLNGALNHLLITSKDSCGGIEPVADDNEDNMFTIDIQICIMVVSFTFAILVYAYHSDQTLKFDRSKIQAYYGVEINADENQNSSRLMLQNCTILGKPLHKGHKLVEGHNLGRYIPPDTSGHMDVRKAQEDAESKVDMPLSSKPAMWKDPRISLPFRIGIPLACVLNFALFLWSNNDVGATVNLEMHIGERILGPFGIFNFGLADTVQDMWDAKVFLLAILIAFFSGFWPYLKIFIMFLAWILPHEKLSECWRQRLLSAMDTLGKWSLIDGFVLTIMMVAFFFEIYVGSQIKVLVTVYPEVLVLFLYDNYIIHQL